MKRIVILIVSLVLLLTITIYIYIAKSGDEKQNQIKETHINDTSEVLDFFDEDSSSNIAIEENTVENHNDITEKQSDIFDDNNQIEKEEIETNNEDNNSCSPYAIEDPNEGELDLFN